MEKHRDMEDDKDKIDRRATAADTMKSEQSFMSNKGPHVGLMWA